MPDIIRVKGEIVAIKPPRRADRYDPDAMGITVKPSGSMTAYWFRWNLETRGMLRKGEIIDIQAVQSGKSDDGKMVFLSRVKIEGDKICTHSLIVREGKKYICEACGVGAVVSVKEEKRWRVNVGI